MHKDAYKNLVGQPPTVSRTLGVTTNADRGESMNATVS